MGKVRSWTYTAAVAALTLAAALPASAGTAAAREKAPTAAVPAAAAACRWAGTYCLHQGEGFTGYTKSIDAKIDGCVPNNKIYWPSADIARPGSISSNAGGGTQLELFTNGNCSGAPTWVVTHGQGLSPAGDRVKSYRVAPRCDLNSVCIYENKDFTGKRWQIRPEYTNLCYNFGPDGEGYGVYNATGYPATFHRVCSLFPRPLPAYTYAVYDSPAKLVKIG